MAGSRGRHQRPDEPDDAAAATEGTGVTPTQPLPIVRREGPGSEPPPVRAVAKRVPSALPALGRDDVSDVPPSARATADRRRRAREAAGASDETAGGSGARAGGSGAASAGSDAPASAPGSAPAGEPAGAPAGEPAGAPQSAAVPRPRPAPPVERAPATVEAADASPDVELVPIGSRSREASSPQPAPVGRHAAPEPAPDAGSEPVSSSGPARPTSEPDPAEPEPAAAGADPAPAGERAAPTPPSGSPTMGQPREAPPDPEVIEATIVDDPPRPYVSADAHTDEWVAVPPAAPGPPPPPGTPPGTAPLGPPPPAEPATAARLRRPAPLGSPAASQTLVLEKPGPGGHPDTWETTPLPPVTDEYEGRRRRRRARRPAPASWLVVLGVVVALSAAVGLPFLFAGGPDRDVEANPSPRTSGPASTAPSRPATGLPIIPAPSVAVDPSPSASPSDATEPSASGTTAGTTPATQTSTTQENPPAPFTLTLEAEDGERQGCATVSTVNGINVVDRLGDEDDWPNCRFDGVVTFNNVSLPTGTFTVTVHYVFAQFNSDSSRYGVLKIDRDGPGGTVTHAHDYPRTTTCCQVWTTPAFTISAGTYDISFTNPGQAGVSNDRAPAIDQIVIQQN